MQSEELGEKNNSMAKSPRVSVAKKASSSEEDDDYMKAKFNISVPVYIPSRPSSPRSPRSKQESYNLQGVFLYTSSILFRLWNTNTNGKFDHL